MAINITQAPQPLYPAYNDSWLEFTSTLSGNNRAEISITGFPIFTLYPQNGKYTFNLKEIVKYEVNKTGFKDNLITGVMWGYSSTLGYLSLSVTIKVFNNSTNESTAKSYTFFKSVKQIGDDIFNNNGQILLPSSNGVEFNATYWSGFPFDFALQRVSGAVTIKNLNSGIITPAFIPTTTGTMRIFVDRVNVNWTNSELLPLSNTVNRLEIFEGGVFKSNLRLKKLNKACGTYLKWFNNQGGYSYYLFDEFHSDDISASSTGYVSQNDFLNIGDVKLSGIKKSLGKVGVRTMKLKSTVDADELKHLEGLFTSPSVQMYSSHRPYEEGKWIDVMVTNSGLSNKTKKVIHKIEVDIELPELINAML